MRFNIFLSTFSTDDKIDKVGLIVYGEARNQIQRGQLAVAYTIVNRVHSSVYPNTFHNVIYATYTSHGHTYYEYNALDVASNEHKWAEAKLHHTTVYQNAIQAAKGALCGLESDPTNGATAYCAYDPCSATTDNRYTRAINKMKIGDHWFVKRVPV